ncbi:MAG: hypothetical protein IJP01_03625, partial [Oscillospiraceae bacterium]|nr:hypothetical protein [Oscillospiraceae bacterium]
MAKITAAKRDEIEKRAAEKFGTAAVEQARQRQQQAVKDANQKYIDLKARQAAENASLTDQQKVERALRSAGSTVTGQATAPAATVKSPFDMQLSAPAPQQTSGPAVPQWQQAQLQGIADSNNRRAKRSFKESAQYVGETADTSFKAGLEALFNDFIDTAATTPVQSYMDLSQAPKSVREQILNGMTEEEYYAQREAELEQWGRDTRSTEWAEAAAAVNDKYGVDAKSGLGVLGAVVGSGAQMAPSLAAGAVSPALGYMTTFSMGRSGGVTDALANG